MGRKKKKVKKERFTFTEEQRTETPPCPYFDRCGGCKYQDIAYPLQVEAKSDWLSQLLEQPVTVHPSPVTYGYRNRMDFVNAFGKLGLREPGSHKWVVDIERCGLISEEANRLLGRVRALLEQHQIPCYNYIVHEGYLRYAVIRSTSLGETLVTFVTVNEDPTILPVMEALKDEATAVFWAVHEGLSDLSFGRIHKTLGTPTIRERIGEQTFQLGPNTFFQNNPYLIHQLVEKVKEFTEGRVLDLYCGVGLLGCAVADRADSVLGVECIDESIELARINARENGVEKIEFEVGEVRPWLREWVQGQKGNFDTVIVDPPREGLSPKVVRNLLRLAPPKIAYVSCNPSNLKMELDLLKEDYETVLLEGYDLFPQTPHAEALALLQRKEI